MADGVLLGKRVLITGGGGGGGGGVGREVAARMVSQGARVVIAGRDEAELQRIAVSISEANGPARSGL